MQDPDSPVNGEPPSPPSPEEEWGSFAGAEHLTHLTDSNFDAFVKKTDSVLVMFYAPCKNNFYTYFIYLLVFNLKIIYLIFLFYHCIT